MVNELKLNARKAKKAINNPNRIREIIVKIINLKVGNTYFIIVFKIEIKILKIKITM
ncbi:MAG: hypothetical protein LBQ24_07900 [Candidatus Peribacteria bacterium]|jgi:hypothetical protein|nr:hypothetical protein [Candidatus Peribacteria bacterium]